MSENSAFRRGDAGDTPARRWDNIQLCPYFVGIVNPWSNTDAFHRAMSWCAEHQSSVYVDTETSSYINGVRYYHYIYFKHQIDHTAFVLTFPELV